MCEWKNVRLLEHRAALDAVAVRKKAGQELAVAPPVEVLSRFIEAELPRLEALNEPDNAADEVEEPFRQAQGPEPVEGLNGFFRRYALAA